jgi:hypothetical protein
MKSLIRKILKEQAQREGLVSKYEISFLRLLHRGGYSNRSTRQEIISYLSNLGVVNMEAFHIYELFKDNYNHDGVYRSEMDPIRVDIKKKKYKTTNKNARELVSSKIPFKGSNIEGKYEDGVYVVYSYDWYPIFVWVDDQWYESSKNYSSSTAKQMGQIRPSNQGRIIKASQQVLSDIIHRGYRE